MPTLNILVHLLPEVFLNHRDLTIGLFRVWIVLKVFQHLRQHAKRVVLGVGYQEGEVDEVVWVGKIVKVREEHGKVGLGVSERRAHEHPFFTLPSPLTPSRVRKIVIPDSL